MLNHWNPDRGVSSIKLWAGSLFTNNPTNFHVVTSLEGFPVLNKPFKLKTLALAKVNSYKQKYDKEFPSYDSSLPGVKEQRTL